MCVIILRLILSDCDPRNVRISEAPSFGKPVLNGNDIKSTGAQAYAGLAAELLAQENLEAKSNS